MSRTAVIYPVNCRAGCRGERESGEESESLASDCFGASEKRGNFPSLSVIIATRTDPVATATGGTAPGLRREFPLNYGPGSANGAPQRIYRRH